MQIQASLVCDSASDYTGKLCVLGAFDTIGAPQAPVIHPHLAVVLQVRFQRSEEGAHRFRLLMIDADGRSVGPKLEGDMNVIVPSERETLVANLVLNINGLQLLRFGSYQFDFSIDGEQRATMPLYFVRMGQIMKAA